jgi:regulator of sigma E protease
VIALRSLTLISFLQTALVFALVLGGMIVLHELGHFIAAKLFGIRVEVFSIGFGKRLFGVRRGATDYRLSLIPLGGYVKMAGENFSARATGAPDEFMSKPKWQRLCVAVAGPAMNILTALAIPAVMAMIHYEVPAYVLKPAVINTVKPGSPADRAGIQRGDLIIKIGNQENPTWRDVQDRVLLNPDQDIPITIKRGDQIKELILHPSVNKIDQEKIGYAGFTPDTGPNTKLVIGSVQPGSPADEAGIKPGDSIVAIDGAKVEQSLYGWEEQVVRTIRTGGGQPVTLTLNRNGETFDVKVTPRMDGGEWRLGISYDLMGVDKIVSRLGPVEAIKYSFDVNRRVVRLTLTAIGQIFVGRRSVRDAFTGPVGIFNFTGQAVQQGASSVLDLMALLSLNLGIFNLLPIPVLDGGLIFMLALEAVLGLFGLPLTLRAKERMIQVGFVVLMLVMAFVIFNDISKMIPSRGASSKQVEQQRPATDK